jgi:hypothetical protein
VPLTVVGLMLVLRNSFRARKQFVRFQHAHPKLLFPLRRLLRREPEVLPVAWQQVLRMERLIMPRRWRVAKRWRQVVSSARAQAPIRQDQAVSSAADARQTAFEALSPPSPSGPGPARNRRARRSAGRRWPSASWCCWPGSC